MPIYSIKQVAERTGLTPPTLRYYEALGLMDGVARDANGNRCYSEADITWIFVLLDLRATGMSLAAMQQFACNRTKGLTAVPEMIAQVEAHLSALEARMTQLRSFSERAQRKLSTLHYFSEAGSEEQLQERRRECSRTVMDMANPTIIHEVQE